MGKVKIVVDNREAPIDNREAAKILQEELNKIDGGKNGRTKNIRH